ncbi:sigma-70 family RNA polymerase sigma factor [Georgenia sp. H159]|uniref:RNA polymerase sigma factor n=1 Tax=Georgenia sp. H159 TaxID=3076115 RepID=UPI002D7762DB|nr:sigma-70 family RNA polymerase sigma factor [Georgenia sp. H159]
MMTKPPFEQVVSTHGATVLRVCRAVVGPDDADDAWSETFLAALRAYPTLDDDVNLEAWLVTVAHRKAVDIIRSRQRRPVPTDRLPERQPSAGPGEDGSDVWHAVATLPDKQRQSIAYHYLAGLPFADVAAVLGGSTDAARRAAADGMKTLRRHYGAPIRGGRR